MNSIINTIMNKKRIFIYDATKGFSRFLKLKLADDIDILCCTNRKELINYDLSSVDLAFVVINDQKDIINFIYIYSKIENIVLYSNMKDVIDRLSGIDSITALNTNLTKSDLLKEIKYNLQLNDIIK